MTTKAIAKNAPSTEAAMTPGEDSLSLLLDEEEEVPLDVPLFLEKDSGIPVPQMLVLYKPRFITGETIPVPAEGVYILLPDVAAQLKRLKLLVEILLAEAAVQVCAAAVLPA
jgi:hypothetical protein